MSGNFYTQTDIDKYKERLFNFSGEFDFGLMIHMFRRSRRWLLLFFLLGCFGAFLYLRYTPRNYQSTAILQIKTADRANQILNVDRLATAGMEHELAESIELLRSKVFLKRALTKLPIEVSYFNEGTFRSLEQYGNHPYFVDFKIKDASIVGQRIYISFDGLGKGSLHYEIGGRKFSRKFEEKHWISLPHVDFKIVVTDYLAINEMNKGVKKNMNFFTINNFDALADQYHKSLDVRILNDGAKTIQITFIDNNARKALDIVAALTLEFNSFDVERRSESSKSILAFIDNQLDVVYERLKNAENALQEYKNKNNIHSVAENISMARQEHANTIEDQIISYDSEEKILEELENSVNGKSAIDTYHLLSMIAGTEYESSVSSLASNLHHLLIRKEEMLYEVTPSSESIKAIDYQINIQRRILLESIGSIRAKLRTRKNLLISQAEKVEAKYSNIPKDEIEFSRLQRLYSTSEKYYTMLLEKKTEYAISKAGFVSQNVVLQKANLPGVPVSPNQKITIFTFLFLATVVSLFFVLVRYFTHTTLTSANEITRYTNASVSILGLVPKYKDEIPVSQLLIDKNPKSLIAEAFRSIRTNLQFISNDPNAKVIAVTSTISGEGKTFISFNLAGIIAFSGKKVIVLDLDLRKPKIHAGFGVSNDKGMSTLLIGKNTLEECIRKSSLENLYFITAGPVPPNPSELIMQESMSVLLTKLKQEFDIIVMDTPPVGLVTDGVSIVKQADYPIYVFRAEYSRRNFVQNLDRLINESHIPQMSVVFNGVELQPSRYSYNYGYGYGYGYGYNYGYYTDPIPQKVGLWKRLLKFFKIKK